MDAVTELERQGGVARVERLRSLGVSAHTLRRAKELGAVRSIRRGWIALPDADPIVVGAATRGVVITCVTAAERMGLWVPNASSVHVAARPNAARVRVPSQVVVRWSRPVVQRDPDSTVDGLVNTLAVVARCQPRETALVIWESALNKGLVDERVLSRFELPPAARELLESARPFSDSGLETIFVSRLRWLGFAVVQQAWLHGHRVDLLIGERLVIQIERHTSEHGGRLTSSMTHSSCSVAITCCGSGTSRSWLAGQKCRRSSWMWSLRAGISADVLACREGDLTQRRTECVIQSFAARDLLRTSRRSPYRGCAPRRRSAPHQATDAVACSTAQVSA
ncbi:hypothetical protein [uncultured Microbacterium sp.]|uniref:hypothetical protein n=1 Tax=uncultured Microbacterium sp. TaxID=191216 RepID=UPI0025FAD91C|nr:hypothetical protein [uncultured Microbacterium sp.]